MLTALIVVSIAFVIMFIVNICLRRDYDRLQKSTASFVKDFRECHLEQLVYQVKCEVYKALKYAYGIPGDIFHHLSGFLGKEVKYVDLIEKLGEYARSMYLYETPLSMLERSVLADKDYRFPQLDEEQSKTLWEFLSDIHGGRRFPEAILELIYALLFDGSFENAMARAKNWNGDKNKK